MTTDAELTATLQAEGKSAEEIAIILQNTKAVRYSNGFNSCQDPLGMCVSIPEQRLPDVLKDANDKAKNNKGE